MVGDINIRYGQNSPESVLNTQPPVTSDPLLTKDGSEPWVSDLLNQATLWFQQQTGLLPHKLEIIDLDDVTQFVPGAQGNRVIGQTISGETMFRFTDEEGNETEVTLGEVVYSAALTDTIPAVGMQHTQHMLTEQMVKTREIKNRIKDRIPLNSRMKEVVNGVIEVWHQRDELASEGWKSIHQSFMALRKGWNRLTPKQKAITTIVVLGGIFTVSCGLADRQKLPEAQMTQVNANEQQSPQEKVTIQAVITEQAALDAMAVFGGEQIEDGRQIDANTLQVIKDGDVIKAVGQKVEDISTLKFVWIMGKVGTIESGNEKPVYLMVRTDTLTGEMKAFLMRQTESANGRVKYEVGTYTAAGDFQEKYWFLFIGSAEQVQMSMGDLSVSEADGKPMGVIDITTNEIKPTAEPGNSWQQALLQLLSPAVFVAQAAPENAIELTPLPPSLSEGTDPLSGPDAVTSTVPSAPVTPEAWQDLGMGYAFSNDTREVKWLDPKTGNDEYLNVDKVMAGSDGSVVLTFEGQLAGIVQVDGQMQRAYGNYVALNHELRQFNPETLQLTKETEVLNVGRLAPVGDYVGAYHFANDHLIALFEPYTGVFHEVFYGSEVVINNVHYHVVGGQKMVDVRDLTETSEYPIVEGFKEEVRADVLGIPVAVDVVVDQSLKDRKEVRIDKVYLNPNYPNAKEAVAEATMRALFYAWRDNDSKFKENRLGMTFEQWMEMVNEYREGNRPLSDVAVKIWANDLLTKDYDPLPYQIDPTKPLKFVYVDIVNPQIDNNVQTIDRAGGPQYGTQINFDSQIEIWAYWSPAFAKTRVSQISMVIFNRGLNRLSWSVAHQIDQFNAASYSEIDDLSYHYDVAESVMKLIGPNWYMGALNVSPNDYDGK